MHLWIEYQSPCRRIESVPKDLYNENGIEHYDARDKEDDAEKAQ
jgi:hypothetical protein